MPSRYILTIVDSYSHLLMAFKVKDMKTDTFLEAMDHLLSVVHRVNLITADNQVSLFRNKKAREYFAKKNIKIRNTLPYSSSSNEAETYNKIIRSFLRSLKDQKTWPKHLMRVVQMINDIPHEKLGAGLDDIPPIELAFGK